MNPELQFALEPVLRDLTHLASVLEIRDEDWAGEQDTLSAMAWAGTTGTGIHVPAGAPKAEQVASLADQIQELVIEELHEAWPPCPKHPANHPLAPELVRDQAVWRCPRTKQIVAEIGHLG